MYGLMREWEEGGEKFFVGSWGVMVWTGFNMLTTFLTYIAGPRRTLKEM